MMTPPQPKDGATSPTSSCSTSSDNKEELNLIATEPQTNTYGTLSNPEMIHVSDNANHDHHTSVAISIGQNSSVEPQPSITTNHTTVVIPSRSQSTWDRDEMMKGWIIRYNYDNVPPEVLVEVFKFLDINTLSQ